MKYFPVKCTADGKAYLNLACGWKTHWAWNNLDFSPYARIRKYPLLAYIAFRLGIFSKKRWERLNSIAPDIVAWDLRNGIPYSDNVYDVVYNSHLLEHLPRKIVFPFLKECLRVLKHDGYIRIVVPDLQSIIKRYMRALEKIEGCDITAWQEYDAALEKLFEQMGRSETVGAKEQKKCVWWIEQMIRGGPEKTGELHLWMYDRFSLARLLSKAGFTTIATVNFYKSSIKGWNDFMLDRYDDGSEYINGSLYMEAIKPKLISSKE